MEAYSIWGLGNPAASTALDDETEVEIAVVGAGVAGLTAAKLMIMQSYAVHVFDGGIPASGMTARSTSHIATALDGGWRATVRNQGIGGARCIASAYRHAVDHIARTVRSEEIACDYTHCDGLLIGTADELKDELTAAKLAGVDASWSNGHPFSAAQDTPAVVFPRQARLHPLKYTAALLASFLGNGGQFHRTPIAKIAPDRMLLTTVSGKRVRVTKAIILATNGGVRSLESSASQGAVISYVIAAKVPKGTVPDVVCWDTEDPYHYARIQPLDTSHDYLIIGGEDHDAGTPVNSRPRHAALEAWARGNFPSMGEVVARWHGQIRQPADNLGLLGRHPDYPCIHVIDGDGGLGFTHATLGALMVSDALAGRKNAWTDIFDPQRFGPWRHRLFADCDTMQLAV